MYQIPPLVMVRRKAIKLVKKGWSYAKIARYLGYNRSTIFRWHKRFEYRHYFGLYDKSKRPRTIDKKTTCFEYQELIIKLRKETHYCHQRLAILLNRDYHLSIKPITIYRILKRNNLIERKKKYQRPFNQPKRPYPITAGSLIQADTKHILINNGKYYQYTFLDVSTRYQVAFISKRLSPIIAGKMLEKSIHQFPFKIKMIQTDNGSEFQRQFRLACLLLGINHRYTRIRNPQENGRVERVHRSIDEEFYKRRILPKSIPLLNQQLSNYLNWYNTQRIHLSLINITPQEEVNRQNEWLNQINQFVAHVLKH